MISTNRLQPVVIEFNGKIEIPENFDISKYIVRTFGIIEGKINQNWHHLIDENYSLLRFDWKYQPSSVIIEQLNAFQSNKHEKNVSFHPTITQNHFTESKELKTISGDKKENDDEQGRLGELATEMSMIGFGYSKYETQNKSNQGLDGVYIDESGEPELFLTESKCRNQSRTAQKVMEKELNEKAIYIKLEKMQSLSIHKETYDKVIDFISRHPERIFKFAHRIKSSGTCQCYIEKFDVKDYRFLSIPNKLQGTDFRIWKLSLIRSVMACAMVGQVS